ncbi:MAG: glycerate kinase [Sporomusaceae bacterium]|nr:glycerate kinase [Sporomusaceae bacterium]
MRIVVAPDSFKGSVSAVETARAMERGILRVFPQASVVKVPIGDGGEGTVEALVAATKGELIAAEVVGPLGNKVQAFWGMLGDGDTAVVEMAAASGLTLVPEGQKDPGVTTTYGTGELIKAALSRGVSKIIVGIGGSSTNDGGCGMIQALGGKFLDANGQALPYGGLALRDLTTIDLSGMDPRLQTVELVVACDVDNPLCGENGASAVYGPQKGASPQMVASLDQSLGHYAVIASKATGRSIAAQAGAGAGGGIGAGFLFFTDAVLRPGVEIVLEATSFDALVKEAAFVMTGEGRTDFQTAFGKAPVGVGKAAQKYDVPVFCLAGGLGQGYEAVFQAGIDGVMSSVPAPMALDECLKGGADFIEVAADRLCRIIAGAMRVKGTKLS